MSLTESIDFSTPSGKLMLTMIGGFSEFFSDQLAVHVVKSQRQRAETGLPIGPIPFGYVPGEPGEAPVVDPEEGEAVREAFATRAAGQSNGAIAGDAESQRAPHEEGAPLHGPRAEGPVQLPFLHWRRDLPRRGVPRPA